MLFHSISPLDCIPPFMQVARRAYLVAKHYIPPMVALTWDPLPVHGRGSRALRRSVPVLVPDPPRGAACRRVRERHLDGGRSEAAAVGRAAGHRSVS